MPTGKYQPLEQSEARQKLLHQADSTEDPACFESARSPLSARRHLIWRSVSLILLLANTITGALLYSLSWRLAVHSDSIAEYPPLAKIVKYRDEYWDLTLGDRSPFTEPPSDQVDAAWDSIAAPPGHVGFVIVQKDELDGMNQTSTPLADGSGYLATVDVFHQLHCLDFLRKAIHNSTYNLTLEHYPLQDSHIAHCIDSIRLSLQCHADISLLGFRWIRDYPYPWPDFRSTHQCRNFDEILSWTRARMPNVDKSDTFRHPELGLIGTSMKTQKWGNPLTREGGIEYIEEV